MNIYFKATVIWLCILVLAVFNGIFRETILHPYTGLMTGYILSGVILSLLIVFVAYLSIPWFGQLRSKIYWFIGAYWLLLTLIFEFGFGLAQGMPLEELLIAYTFQDGNIWSLILLIILCAPRGMAKCREMT